MRFGVNYTPRVGWFHSWLDFDADAVRRDFAQIAELEVDHVRIFPLWDLIQPNRGLIRPVGLAAVGQVVDVAAEFGLDVNVDALQGHLSSFDFLPAWVSTWHGRNIFAEPDVVAGEEAFIRALGDTLAGRDNILGLTIGNEVSQFAARPHPDPHEIDPAQAEAWLARLIGAARDSATGLITHATYDATWYDERQPFLPRHAAELGDETVVHSWVFNGAAQRHGGLGTGSVRHAEYLTQLAAAWHTSGDRRVWLQEIGVPVTVVDRGDAVEFLERTVRHAAGVAGMSGITWWCSHDVSRTMLDFPAVEYDLGLIDENGRIKPTGRAFAELARELRSAPSPAPVATALVLDDAAATHARCAPGGGFFEAWMRAAARDGVGPQIVLRSRAQDRALLSARGIRRLIDTDDAASSAASATGGGAAATMTS
ncbi:glycoside hydrolase 5 family protein [Microbacterium karelineae]|uniref:glycoside hydrolase 5 family protein n=1 Tax=Microbacterium karelineae TaxID=2654283 RepID=UPI0012EA05D5|nr:glycosyl hydrolase [Microbacterium karelineae]